VVKVEAGGVEAEEEPVSQTAAAIKSCDSSSDDSKAGTLFAGDGVVVGCRNV